MKRHLRVAAIAACAASLGVSSARAQETQVLLPVPPPVQPPSQSTRFDSLHLAPEHSDAGLGVKEYFAAMGLQTAASGALATIALGILVATQANQYGRERDRDAILITIGVLAPPILALPSSAIPYKVGKGNCPRERSWGWTYLAGVAGNALTMGAAALFWSKGWDHYSDAFPGMNEIGLAGILLAGSLVTAGLEVVALNLSGGAQVAAAPMVLKDGAGVSVGGSF